MNNCRITCTFIPFTLLNFVTLLRRSCRNIFFEKVTSFFEMLRLELPRSLITQRTVKTFVNVVGFDILEQLSARNRLGLKNLISWQTFAFKRIGTEHPFLTNETNMTYTPKEKKLIALANNGAPHAGELANAATASLSRSANVVCVMRTWSMV